MKLAKKSEQRERAGEKKQRLWWAVAAAPVKCVEQFHNTPVFIIRLSMPVNRCFEVWIEKKVYQEWQIIGMKCSNYTLRRFKTHTPKKMHKHTTPSNNNKRINERKESSPSTSLWVIVSARENSLHNFNFLPENTKLVWSVKCVTQKKNKQHKKLITNWLLLFFFLFILLSSSSIFHHNSVIYRWFNTR